MEPKDSGRPSRQDSRPETSTSDAKAQANNNSGQGSFAISRRAIDVLIANRARAAQIATYLVLARYSDASGELTSCGISGIKRALGIGDGIAQRAVDSLMRMNSNGRLITGNLDKCSSKMRLMYSPEQWARIRKTSIPEGATVRASVRYVLNGFGNEQRVWFGNELVDGYGQFQQPLKRLKRGGDIAARLLLLLYAANDNDVFIGVPPAGNAYHKFETERVVTIGAYDLYHAEDADQTAYPSLFLPSLGISRLPEKESEQDEAMRRFWHALRFLVNAGFIYSVITVLDAAIDHPDTQPIYFLHTKTRHGYRPAGEEGVAGALARIADRYDCPVTDSSGRFYNKFAAIVPAGVQPHVAGIYRLRFRVRNVRNHTIKTAWTNLRRSQAEVHDWVRELNGEGDSAELEEEEPACNAANVWLDDGDEKPQIFH